MRENKISKGRKSTRTTTKLYHPIIFSNVKLIVMKEEERREQEHIAYNHFTMSEQQHKNYNKHKNNSVLQYYFKIQHTLTSYNIHVPHPISPKCIAIWSQLKSREINSLSVVQ